MGRDFENRKNAIFKTAASKSKLYAKYGKQVYVLAKNGVPDPEANPALRNLIEKAKRDQVPSHVIEKAIEKAKGILMHARGMSEEEAYAEMRKLAMDRKVKLAEIAQRILDAKRLLS